MPDTSRHMPTYASDHELRVSSISFLMSDIEAAIIALTKETNPAECRTEILPWLAYEASADFWDPAWIEETSVLSSQHNGKSTGTKARPTLCAMRWKWLVSKAIWLSGGKWSRPVNPAHLK